MTVVRRLGRFRDAVLALDGRGLLPGVRPRRRGGGQATKKGRPSLAEVARGGGWCEPGLEELLVELDLALRAGPRPASVAVFVRDGSLPWHELVRGSFPRARVVVVDPVRTDHDSLHADLAAAGRLHAIVDDTLAGDARMPALAEVFLHLRPGGVLLVRRGELAPGQDPDPWTALAREVDVRGPGTVASDRGLDWPVFPEAVGEVRPAPGHVALVNRVRAFAKLREQQMDSVIEQRASSKAQVLTTLPATELTARCELRQNAEARDSSMPEHYTVPAMRLRRYRNVLCAPRQVAVQGNVLLPDTYRFNAAPALQNRFAPDLGCDFADLRVPRARVRAAKWLEGAYFYLDSEWTHHFGHAMTEQMSRLWAASRAREEEPGLKALVSRRRSGTGLAEYEREIFGAAGFAESDIVLHHRPVRVRTLLAASPMWVLPTHVHPDVRDLWRDLGGRIAARAGHLEHARRIFCSRRRSRRSCHNLSEVEELFRKNGFAVVYPEDLAFVDQVEMFRQAEVIAGFAGSAMFTSLFCPTPRHLIVLGPTSYPSRNEYMICAAVGHRLDHVWSEPHPQEAAGDLPQYAGFRFDFAREGVFLRQILAEL